MTPYRSFVNLLRWLETAINADFDHDYLWSAS